MLFEREYPETKQEFLAIKLDTMKTKNLSFKEKTNHLRKQNKAELWNTTHQKSLWEKKLAKYLSSTFRTKLPILQSVKKCDVSITNIVQCYLRQSLCVDKKNTN